MERSALIQVPGAGDFVDRQRGTVAEQLPRRREVFPERHFHGAPAARGQGVEHGIVFDDTALSERAQFRRALNNILLEPRWNDNIRNCCLSHRLVDG